MRTVLPLVSIDADNPILPKHLHESGLLVPIPGDTFKIEVNDSLRVAIANAKGLVFLCSPRSETGCIASLQGAIAKSGMGSFLVRDRACKVADAGEPTPGSCHVGKAVETCDTDSPEVKRAVAALHATIRTQIRFEEPLRRILWRELLKVTNPDVLAASSVRFTCANNEARQSFIEQNSLAGRLLLARTSVLVFRRECREEGRIRRRRSLAAAGHQIVVEENCLWSKALAHWEFGSGPERTFSTNPLVFGDALFVISSSPSVVRALCRLDGKALWTKKLSGFAKKPLLAGETLIVPTTNTIYAFEPQSGTPLWSFCPYGTESEWFYSYPVYYRSRLFFGDNNGHSNCIDATTGNWLWTVDSECPRSNGTPAARDGRVFFYSIQPRISCHVADTGHYLWAIELEGHPIGPLTFYRDALLVCTKRSLITYHPETGALLTTKSFPGREIGCSCVAGRRVFLHLMDSDSDAPGAVVCLVDNEERWCLEALPFTRELVWNESTKLLFARRFAGISAIDPTSGNRIFELVSGSDKGSPEMPFVDENFVYICLDSGKCFVLKLPAR